MMLSRQDDRFSYSLFLIVTGVSMLALSVLTPPTLSDDILYRMIFQYDDDAPVRLAHTLGDIIDSQIVHYHTINGRSIVHIVVQVMLCMAPPMVFNVLNALLFTWLAMLAGRFSGNATNRLFCSSVFVFLVFIVMKGFRSACLWLPGSINYIWPMAFTMAFLIWFNNIKVRDISIRHVLLSPLALLVGWTHEALQLPLMMGFMLYAIVNRRYICHRAVFPYIVFHAIGTCLCIFSPAIMMRADGESMSLTARLLAGAMNFATNVRVSWFLAAMLSYMYFRKRAILSDEFFKRYWLYFAWIASLGIVFLCGTTLERVGFCADFYASLLLISMSTRLGIDKFARPILTVMYVTMIAVLIPTLKLAAENHANYEYHAAQAKSDSTYIIKVRQIPETGSTISSILQERYIFPTIEYGFYSCYQAFDAADINNRCAAAVYGKDSIVFIPEDIMDNINNNVHAYDTYRLDEHGKLYTWELPKGTIVDGITFELAREDMSNLSLKDRIMAYKGNEYELPRSKFKTVDINGKTYLLFTKPTPNIIRRLTHIRLTTR